MFVKFSDVYAMPQKQLTADAYQLRGDWLPELYGLRQNWDLMQALDQEGRLIIKQVAYVYIDDRRYASVNTLWLDGEPFAIVGNGGREGGDAKQRFITNPAVYAKAIGYVMHRMTEFQTMYESDNVNPDDKVPAELIFNFYTELSRQQGIEPEKASNDYQLIHGRDVLPSLDGDYIIAGCKTADAAELVRRTQTYLKRVRTLSDAEHQENPRIREVFAKDGYLHVFIYEVLETAPENPELVPVI